jgi:hypothetical protein
LIAYVNNLYAASLFVKAEMSSEAVSEALLARLLLYMATMEKQADM